MAIVIVDNGKGASSIASSVYGSEIIKPGEISSVKNASAWILTDGQPTSENKKCIGLVQSTNKPLMGIGLGYLYLASAFGAEIEKGDAKRGIKVTITRNCALTNNFRKFFMAVNDCKFSLKELPDCFDVMAKSGYEYEIIADMENPFFGVHFNPELSAETMIMFRNFQKFVEVWEKYHK